MPVFLRAFFIYFGRELDLSLNTHVGPCASSSAACHLSTTLFGTVKVFSPRRRSLVFESVTSLRSIAALALARSLPALAAHSCSRVVGVGGRQRQGLARLCKV
jgi:hypothetical protein